MRTLSEMVSEAGLSQAEIAERLGVTQPSVSYWLSGRQPVPARRVAALARVLGADVEELSPYVSSARGVRGRPTRREKEEPVTMLGYLLRWGSMSSHLGDHYASRLQGAALRLGVTAQAVDYWAEHGIPIEYAAKLGGVWPLLPLQVFAEEATFGAETDEPEAVASFLAGLAVDDPDAPRTFSEFKVLVEDAWDEWANSPSVTDPKRAREILDDGRVPAEWWRNLAAELRERKAKR